jgi:hypothetical protein
MGPWGFPASRLNRWGLLRLFGSWFLSGLFFEGSFRWGFPFGGLVIRDLDTRDRLRRLFFLRRMLVRRLHLRRRFVQLKIHLVRK